MRRLHYFPGERDLFCNTVANDVYYDGLYDHTIYKCKTCNNKWSSEFTENLPECKHLNKRLKMKLTVLLLGIVIGGVSMSIYYNIITFPLCLQNYQAEVK